MWKIAICDDEPAVAENLKRQIKKIYPGKYQSIVTYKEAGSFLEDICEGKVDADIIFIDIQLGQYNGIEISEKLLSIKPVTQIIFISGYDKYYEAVYEVDHAYFIQKPIQADALERAMNKAETKLAGISKRCICICTRGRTVMVPYDEICSLENDKRKILIKTQGGEQYGMYGKLDDIIDKLDSSFVRCHNSFIINFAKVKVLEKNIFVLEGGQRIPLSRTYLTDVKERFAKYIEDTYNN